MGHLDEPSAARWHCGHAESSGGVFPRGMRLENRMDPVDDIKESNREIWSRDAADDACDIVDPVDSGREIPVLVLGEPVFGGRTAQELGHLVLFRSGGPCLCPGLQG